MEPGNPAFTLVSGLFVCGGEIKLFLSKKIERRRNAVLTKTQRVFMILILLYAYKVKKSIDSKKSISKLFQK